MGNDTELKLKNIMDNETLSNFSVKQVSEYTYEFEKSDLSVKWQVVLQGNNFKKFISTINGWKLEEKGYFDKT